MLIHLLKVLKTEDERTRVAYQVHCLQNLMCIPVLPNVLGFTKRWEEVGNK